MRNKKDTMIIRNQKIGVLGFARSGIAVANKVLDNGGIPFISELKPIQDVRESFIDKYGNELWERLLPYCEFGKHTEKVLENDLLVVSPGIPLDIPIIKQAKEKGITVIGEIEFAYLLKAKDSKIIAVTGSNGKSTTVSLIHHILQTAGYNSLLAGNIGNSFTATPCEKPGIDYIVLELSSFQLELVKSFTANTAILLNITPDHLDRYSTISEYVKAKLNIFNCQTNDNLAILNADDNAVLKETSFLPSRKLYFGTKSSFNLDAYFDEGSITILAGRRDKPFKIHQSTLSLAGLHNVYNIMAALLAVSDISIPHDALVQALKTFQPLPHRLEKVAEINGVTFINDSKATNTDSVKYALTAYDAPIHIILGGYHKGEDYSVLLPFIAKQSKAVYLIGDSAMRMLNDFKMLNTPPSQHQVYLCDSLEQAVEKAANNAEKGEIVMLSPACASYDMFDNFEHRGNVFKQAVSNLIAKVK